MSGNNNEPIQTLNNNAIDPVQLLSVCIRWQASTTDNNRDTNFRTEFKTIVNNIGGICDSGGGGGGGTEPIPLFQSVSTDKNKPIQITLTSTNPKNEYIIFLTLTDPLQGKISDFDGISGKLTYTPNIDVENTTDSFNFTINVNGTNSTKHANIKIAIGVIEVTPTPTPTPTPQPGSSIGPDGIIQIFASDSGANEHYQGKQPPKDVFNVSYGGGSMLPYTVKNENGLDYVNTPGSKITYNSGSPPGRSTRWDVYGKPGLYQNKTKYAWNNLPKDGAYLYENVPTCIRNEEFTTYVRVHGSLGTHESYAHKIGGRNDDTIRSLTESVHPTATHKDVQVNVNYAHFPYVNVVPKIFNNPPTLKDDGKWYGWKTIKYVNPDGKSSHWESWFDYDGIDIQTGKSKNNWKLAMTYEDHGASGYKNIPWIWASEKSVLRVDGFETVDIAFSSVREINPSKRNVEIPTNHLAKLQELRDKGESEHMIFIMEADPLESEEEAEVRKKLQDEQSRTNITR